MPLVHEGMERGEGDGEEAHQHVAKSQVHDEDVGRTLQNIYHGYFEITYKFVLSTTRFMFMISCFKITPS